MELFGYYRSSATFRVRIALNLKALDYQITPVNLATGEQREAAYLAINPQGLVPSLRTDEGSMMSQSTAILEWLEESYPSTPLLPAEPMARAHVRSLCSQIACDIQPICNLRVLNHVSQDLALGTEGKMAWVNHWIKLGFEAFEQQLGDGPYCAGQNVSLADVYLYPQFYNAERFNIDLEAFPKIRGVIAACNELSAFQTARPENQPDFKA